MSGSDGDASALFQRATHGQAQPIPFRAELERKTGHDLSEVNAYLGRSDELRPLGATAASWSNRVAFAAGAPSQRVVAHEVAHVLQAPENRDPQRPPAGLSDPRSAAEAEASRLAERPGDVSRRTLAEAPPLIHRSFLDDLQATLVKGLHRLQQQRVYNLIGSGLSIAPDPDQGILDPNFLWRNSCEWIITNGCSVLVLSPIHDATTRNPGKIGYFDATVFYPDVGGTYPADPAVVNDPHIRYEDPGAVGGMSPGGTQLTVLDPASSDDAFLRETIIHEVQHDADQSWPGQRWADPGGSAFNDYQSEFRSYWIEAGEGSPDDRFGSSLDPAENSRTVTFTDPASGSTTRRATSFANRRQETIFWHLVDAGYGYVPQNYVQVPAFKAMVDGFDQPAGGNLVNSIRIQAVSDAVARCAPSMDAESGPVIDMVEAARGMDELDRAYLQDEELSRAFWEQADGQLSDSVREMLHNLVWFGTTQPWGDFPAETEPAGQAHA